MTKVFLDSDVILDFLLDREPFSRDAGAIFARGEIGSLDLYTSTISFLNVHYIAGSRTDRRTSRSLVQRLRQLVSLLPVTEQMIDRALASQMADLEDSVQLHCSRDAQMDFLVTRNSADYPKEDRTVLDPQLFLATLSSDADIPRE